jgi:hypothetical protein
MMPAKRSNTLPAALGKRFDIVATRIAAHDEARDEIGRELIALKDASPHGTFGPALEERGIKARTAQFFMQCVKDETARERDVQRKRDSRTTKAQPVAHLPAVQPAAAPVLKGELHEAARGFKAAAMRAKKARAADKMREAMQWETTALGHLKLLVSRSNLPAVAGMTVDEIMSTINWRLS